MKDLLDDKNWSKYRETCEKQYHLISPIHCPYLKDKVHFSAEGFQHLLFKSWNRSRSREEQATRLRLITLAPKIIRASHTLQEFDERKIFVRQKINSRWEKKLKIVRYYAFVAIIEKLRVKIIVKEIEGRTKQFYSIYPSWKTDKNSKQKIFHSGNLEED